MEGHYRNGKLDGLVTEWYDSGQKQAETHFKNGKLDGLETWWDKNGKKSVEVHYKDGKEVSRKDF